MTASLSEDIAALRPQLLRFALLQLRDETAAEDAVQETLLAAINAGKGFEGRAALRTWLIGILKNKIVDHIRRQAREPNLGELPEPEQGDEGDFDSLFQEDGHWAEAPASWGDPQRSLVNRRFQDVLEACMELLPPQTARIFLMREMLGLETEEICQELAISTSNCWVVLYRARMRLRDCLQKNWFGESTATEMP